MIKRKWLFWTMLAAAGLTPAALTDGNWKRWSSQAQGWLASKPASSSPAGAAVNDPALPGNYWNGAAAPTPYPWPAYGAATSPGVAPTTVPATPPAIPPAAAATLTLGPATPVPLGASTPSAAAAIAFDDLFRFDQSQNAVIARWPRVTTVLSETNLEGLRVAVVTGPRIDDLAGALTYYFDKNGETARVSFTGTTGDERRLVTFLMERYRFQAEPALGPGLYLYKWNGKPTSVLRVSHSPVVKADSAFSRRRIDLEINRPFQPYNWGLTEPLDNTLQYDKHIGRW